MKPLCKPPRVEDEERAGSLRATPVLPGLTRGVAADPDKRYRPRSLAPHHGIFVPGGDFKCRKSRISEKKDLRPAPLRLCDPRVREQLLSRYRSAGAVF